MEDYGLTTEDIQAIIEEAKRIEKERQNRKSQFLPEEAIGTAAEGFNTDPESQNTLDDDDIYDDEIYTEDQRMLDEDIAIDEGDNPFDRIPG